MKKINALMLIMKVVLSLFSVFLIVMMIGEKIYLVIHRLSWSEILGLICIPVIYLTGNVLIWKKEILGSAIIFSSVLLFNIIFMIVRKEVTFDIEFGFLMVVSTISFFLGILKKERKVLESE
ncbi:MAG: hypothetical protein PHD85_04035 [Bacilli bacterium]|nr:hypothetical protein [Bacilli bacterium]MDD3348804.1 hypothetical protein [Bacilli bacterium]MDD4056440.1 hypothetical protein [Bacilli bacterium]